MKNKIKWQGLALILSLVFTFIACDNGNGEETHTHDYSAAWTTNAAQHWHECSCGDKKDLADHQWQWVETTPDTAEAYTLETETCVCGATKGGRGTITAFGKTATVTGDASIPKKDFNAAVANLKDSLVVLEGAPLPDSVKTKLANIMGRTIRIVPGDAAPVANASKELVVGVGYLKSTDGPTIRHALITLAINGAFAD
jgi:hypothetical protein